MGFISSVRATPSLDAVVIESFRPEKFASPDLIEAEAILREHGFLPMDYNPWTRESIPLLNPNDGGQNTIYARDPENIGPGLKLAAPIRAFGTNL